MMKEMRPMFQVEGIAVFGLAVVTSISGLALAAQTADPAVIQARLTSQFKLTTTAADRSEIVTPGAVVEMHRQGMMIYSVAAPLPPSNTYKNGKIGQGWGGFGKDLAITMLAPGGATSDSYPKAQFAIGDKCWVTGLNSKRQCGFSALQRPHRRYPLLRESEDSFSQQEGNAIVRCRPANGGRGADGCTDRGWVCNGCRQSTCSGARHEPGGRRTTGPRLWKVHPDGQGRGTRFCFRYRRDPAYPGRSAEPRRL